MNPFSRSLVITTLLRLAAPLAPLSLLAGCHGNHRQSILHPAGPGAEGIARLWWFLFGVCLLVFVLTMLLLLIGIARKPGADRTVSALGNRFIIVAGVAIPAVILVFILVQGMNATVRGRPTEKALTIQVTGHQWWWDVRYPAEQIVTANELYIPTGVPVRIELKSNDVIHSFWVPNLEGKMDLLPDMTRTLWLQADAPGKYRGQCAEFCGVQHALMGFWVVALPPEEFDAWVARQQQPVPEPVEPAPIRGRQVFFKHEKAGCANCHAVGGEGGTTPPTGPDLTHIASRLTIGAGTLPNNHANLTGWVADPQAIKPGNKMPRTSVRPDDLHDLIEYLKILK